MTILGIMGQTSSEKAKEETEEHSLRAEIFKRVALGGGWSIGASIVFGAYEILHSNPHDAFPLLRSWGPWAIVTMIALYVGYDIVKMVLNIGVRAVTALEQLAVAQQQTADKDDRQIQEIQTLSSFSAQESERTSTKMALLMEMLKESLDRSENDRSIVEGLDRKLDQALNAARGQGKV